MDHVIARPGGRHRPGLLSRIGRALRLRRQRAHLRDLGDHLLDDIGVTRDAAQREASRPIWDVPDSWRS